MAAPAVFPFPANAAEPIQENYGYLTAIQSSSDGTEQRQQLRRHPVGSVEFTYLCANESEAQALTALLYANQDKVLAIPLWHYASPLMADAPIGATRFTQFTASIPYQDPLGLGPYILFYKTPASYELRGIARIFTNSIWLSEPTVQNWTAASGTKVIPVRLGRLDTSIPTTWQTSKVLTGRIKFTFDAAE